MTALPALPATPRGAVPAQSSARTIVTLVVFATALALGVAVHVATSTPPRTVDRFPTITGAAPEPPTSAAITRAITAKDPKALAGAYSAELLQAFQSAIAPLVDVDEIRYTGGVEQAGETLASYVATGRDDQGQSVITGFVIHVKDGSITGFN
jgi:hypothetical protein